jgi:hypothetical protein
MPDHADRGVEGALDIARQVREHYSERLRIRLYAPAAARSISERAAEAGAS